MATTNDESNSKYLIINGQTISEDGSVENNFIPKDALIYSGHSYYIYSNVAETWEAAKAYCEVLGGHLAVINDAAENSELYKYKVQQGYATVYLGLTDANHEGEWTWVTGEPGTKVIRVMNLTMVLAVRLKITRNFGMVPILLVIMLTLGMTELFQKELLSFANGAENLLASPRMMTLAIILLTIKSF